MASNQQQIKGWGCLFILGGIGIWVLFFLLTWLVGGGGSSGEKWGFLGIGAFCVLLGLVLLALPGPKHGVFAQCPHCHAKCQILCSKCGGWNLDLVFQQGQPDLDHVAGFICGTGPKVIGGCGATMDAVTCPKCQRVVPVSKLRVSVPSGGNSSRGCGLIALVICVAYLAFSYMQTRHRVLRRISPPPPAKQAAFQAELKSQRKTIGSLSPKASPVTNAPVTSNDETVTRVEEVINAPVVAETPLLTGAVKARLGGRITIDLGRRDKIKVGIILEVEGPSATELKVDAVYPSQCAAVRVRETDPLPALGDRVHVKSQQRR